MYKPPLHLIAGEVPAMRIYLNGVEIHDVTEAHTGEGWLLKTVRNFEGSLIVRNGAIVTEKLNGFVTAEVIGGKVIHERKTRAS